MEYFQAVIERAPRGGAYVTVPESVVLAIGGGKRIPVSATFDGMAYRGSVVRMRGSHILGVLKEIRTSLDKDVGNSLRIGIQRDASERTVEVPPDLAEALAEASLTDVFAALSLSHRRQYVRWVDEAKKDVTRNRRIRETINRLAAG